MYTIKHAAELTGVPVATLRAWERRYAVVTPRRTDSGYRLYDDHSLGTITAIRDLVASGWSVRQAAAEVKRHRADPGHLPGDAPAVPGSAAALGPAAVAGGDRPFGDLVAVAAELDVSGLASLLDDRFSRGSFETVVDGWLMPALDELGMAWADGRVGVAGEHLVSHAVGRRLAAAYEAAAHNPLGARVVLGLPPGAHHELGILAFATAARRAGLATTYLGADLPAKDWAAAVTRHEVRGAVLSVVREEDLVGLRAVVALVREARPRFRVAVGGRYQHLAPEGTSPLGHTIADAAARLARELID